MDFIVNLPKTRKGHNAIFVVVDCLSKQAHLFPQNQQLQLVKQPNCLQIKYIDFMSYLKKLYLTGIQSSFVPFGQCYLRHWTQNYVLVLPTT
jgi:sulfur relay (sulfurtransferase) DsrF/TusC family protein